MPLLDSFVVLGIRGVVEVVFHLDCCSFLNSMQVSPVRVGADFV